ncbi:MAG: META domain-containing protein [Candidatus Pacebacteria bacterium]|nr:META domain-containing protein [Candidatus Paceibacterota bacterium]
MKTKLIILVSLFIVVVAGGYFIYTAPKEVGNVVTPVVVDKTDIHDGTYTINGEKVMLKNGFSEVPSAPGSASKIVTKYFGNDVSHDLDNDGTPDLAFLVTQTTGGSGTFYYVLALLNKSTGPVGSDAVLLGDRIAPQSTSIDEGKTANGTNRQNVIVVNYADRKPGESFAVAPSVGKSIWLKLDPSTMKFVEVAQNFEGETGVSKMTLGMKTWNWIKSTSNDGSVITPKKPGVFTLQFKNDKTFSATTDCNGIGGEYIVKDTQISFDRMMSTMMYCEGSQETGFSGMLSAVQSYYFTPKGELILNLKYDSGSMIFR